MKTLDDLVDSEVARIERSKTLLADDTATFSPCGTYRYELTRELGGTVPLVVCGLNPSTATATVNDPTVRREIGFASRWKCGRYVKTNAYGFRATDPRDMKAARAAGTDIVGPDNIATIRAAAQLARKHEGIFLVAWGAHIDRDWETVLADLILESYGQPWCLGVTREGHPKHPLYLANDTPLQPWSCPR